MTRLDAVCSDWIGGNFGRSNAGQCNSVLPSRRLRLQPPLIPRSSVLGLESDTCENGIGNGDVVNASECRKEFSRGEAILYNSRLEEKNVHGRVPCWTALPRSHVQ